MNTITISDPTLRDGNHAVAHQLTREQIKNYCRHANDTGIDIIEVGHGNGLGASSVTLGKAKVNDSLMLETARNELTNSKLGIHFIPGFGRSDDLKCAFNFYVDVYRIACHCTEVNITERYIDLVKSEGKTAYGVLMMSHMLNVEQTIENSKLLESYGADAIILMDSAGNFITSDVNKKVTALNNTLSIPVGFHAHNNLGLAISNTVEAIKCGAEIVDGCIKGFGAGAGNTQLEVLIAVMERLDIPNNTSLEKIIELTKISEDFIVNQPTIKPGNILSGCYGLFSGFSKHVSKQSLAFNVPEFEIYKSLRDRKLVAGQEDIILEVASNLSKHNIE